MTDLALAWDAAMHTVHLSWTAPRDDDRDDRVAAYQIRYSSSFPLDWWTASLVPDPPVPMTAGSSQTYALAADERGRELYVAMRCIDDAGLLSPVSSVVHVRVPGYAFEATALDIAGAPIADLDVHLIERIAHDFVTGADGRIAIDDLTETDIDLRITTGAATTMYHTLRHVFLLDTDRAHTYSMIEYQPLINASPYENLFQVLFDGFIALDTVLKKWQSLPVPWYAPAFVNGSGLDYYDAAARAAARWNQATGLPLFVAVGTAPVSGVTIAYLPPAMMGGQNGITTYGSDPQGYPLLDSIRIVDTMSDGDRLYSIMLHELGHTIRLGHLDGNSYIMYAGQPLPSDISDVEVRTVQLMHALPNGIDLGLYDLAAPR